ncbi:MFS transporter [Terribacillus saccharophilus]|uniref:MFS transporter n=1 Tax=Terribacillus saccharophilus TaxID=361277 RepID=UPI000BA60E7E|nr:MFS transporter [Terribacillus saccharophilus]PAF17573.1 MFS transporter [Terribacillus saccharophilus]PAF22341.1 MFS transporter [Terribacillus saccharophilus]PAF38531.1 MFS transporter [Terribacillus saccharophilus]
MFFIFLIYLSFISLGLPDSILGSAWPLMNTDLGVPIGNAGIASIIISTGTIISSLFSYRLIRVLGTGKIVIISIAMTAVALLGFSFSPSFAWLLLCAIPLGLGAGAVDAALNRFVATHYEAKHMNWLHGFWGVGALLGPIILSTLVLWGNSWRSGYFTISLLQFALVLLLLFSLSKWKKYEATDNNSIQYNKEFNSESRMGLFNSFKKKGSIFGMVSFFLIASTEASIMLWGSSYLVRIEDVPAESAAGWISLYFLGMTAGRMLSGFLSIRISNEALIQIGCTLTVSGLLIMLLPLPIIFTLLSFVIIGTGLAPIYPSMLHQTPIYFGKHNSQAAMGIQMAFAYTGATLVAPLLGQSLANISFLIFPYFLLVCVAGILFCRLILIRANKITVESKRLSQ